MCECVCVCECLKYFTLASGIDSVWLRERTKEPPSLVSVVVTLSHTQKEGATHTFLPLTQLLYIAYSRQFFN